MKTEVRSCWIYEAFCIMNKYKICTKCDKKLLATKENFNAQKNGKYGLRSICKYCSKEYRKIYTSTDEYKKKHRERQAKWRKENPEKTLEISRKSYKKHCKRRNSERVEKYKTDPIYKAKVKELEKIYKESGRRYEVSSTPEQREKNRLRNKKRRDCDEYKKKEYARNEIYRKENKEMLHKIHIKNRKELVPSYVAHTMRISTKDLTPEIYETKKLIIKLKRELKNNNIKIR